MKFDLKYIKDYIYIFGILFALLLPTIKDKLGINQVETQINTNRRDLDDQMQQLREINCNNIVMMKGLVRLQNEAYNINELLFSKLKIDAYEVSMARSRISDVKKEVLDNLKSVGEKHQCIF